jgi:hypothetical protein
MGWLLTGPQHFDTIPPFRDVERAARRPECIASGFLKFSYRWATRGTRDPGVEQTYCYEGCIGTVTALHPSHFTRSWHATLRPLRVTLPFSRKYKNRIRNKVWSWFHGKWALNSEMMCTRADSLSHKFEGVMHFLNPTPIQLYSVALCKMSLCVDPYKLEKTDFLEGY